MMSKFTIREAIRASSVKRWHIVNTSKPQTVGEHSFNVALIAAEICIRINRIDWLPHAVVMAIEHDLDEVFTGDIPAAAKSPRKWPREFEPQTIVKIADIIDAYVFIDEYRIDRHGDKVSQWMHNVFNDMVHFYNELPQMRAIINTAIQVTDELTDGDYHFDHHEYS